MTDTTETKTAGRSSPASPQADELPIHWAPATLTKHLQSPQVQLDGRTPGRIKSWTQRDGQGWNLSRLKKTINNHSFFRGNQGTKKPRELRRVWWCSRMGAALEGACCYQNRCYYNDWEPGFVLPPKEKQQTHQPIDLAHRMHQSRLSSWLHLGPSLSLQIHQWFLGWPQSSPLDLILFHFFGLLAWPGCASSPQTCLVTWALGKTCPSFTGLLSAGLAGKERHLELTWLLPLLALLLTQYRLQIPSIPDEQYCRGCSLDKKNCSLNMSVHP